MSPAVFSRSTTQETIPWDAVTATPTPSKKAKSSPPPVPTASKSGCKRELFGAPAPRPTSKPKPGVSVKTELESPAPSSMRVVPSKSAARPVAPPPISAQVPNRTGDSAAVLVVPKATPKVPSPPPPKSSSLSPAESTPAQITTPRPLPNQAITSSKGSTDVSTPPPVSRATSPERSFEAQAAWEEQVYDKIYQKTEAELQALLARARKQPHFERYIKQLERDVGGDQDSSWGMTEPIDGKILFRKSLI